jgi:hypothetical protein
VPQECERAGIVGNRETFWIARDPGKPERSRVARAERTRASPGPVFENVAGTDPEGVCTRSSPGAGTDPEGVCTRSSPGAGTDPEGVCTRRGACRGDRPCGMKGKL